MAETVYLGLGSNLGDPEANLREAIARLRRVPGLEVLAISSFVTTAAMLPPEDPTPQPEYRNAVVKAATTLEPLELLRAMLVVERAMGRIRTTRWAARLIDLDLLAMGARRFDSPELKLPHPGLTERRFVLEPLAEVAPDFVHPVTGESVSQLLARAR